MLDPAKLEEQLIGAGRLKKEQIEFAGKHADRESTSLEQALVSLNVVGYPDLGVCYSNVHGLPYSSLLAAAPSNDARNLFSSRYAAITKVFPAAYDSDANLLTVAVHDPGQISRVEGVYRFFMMPCSLAFQVASEAEIEKALEIHFGVLQAELSDVLPTPAAAPGQTAPPAAAARSARKRTLRPVFDKEAVARQPVTPTAQKTGRTVVVPGPEFSYQNMSRALIATAAVMAREHLEAKPAGFEEVRERVRYCRLLSSRLSLPPAETDGAVLAAWLSSLEDDQEALKQIITPYKLEEVLLPDDSARADSRTESRILSLVKCYQHLRKTDPVSARDVNLTRKRMRIAWSSAAERQDVLETFLQVLMDEEFLARSGKAVGRILIVDQSEASSPILAPPLHRDGYEVEVAPTAAAADEIMLRFPPDLIICDADIPEVSGLKFLQKIKRAEKTAHIPVVMITTQGAESRETECLRAGADDFLTKPVDLELLFLRIHRLTPVPAQQDMKAGVSGSLADMSFTDMLQILCAGGKSMEIVLTRGDRAGQVYVENGDVVHARAGDKEGEKAFFELMRWREGEFSTRQCGAPPARTIRCTLMSLLMEGAHREDEGK